MNPSSWNLPGGDGAGDMVRVTGLCFDYGGKQALHQVGLRIPPGEIFGLLGPNGAGKSTMFRILATLQTPTAGTVRLGQWDTRQHPHSARAILAYMPDQAPLPSDLKAVEYLRFFAEAYGIRGKERDVRVSECLDAVGLTGRATERCHRLSLGMRQRLALAKSVLHHPRLLILDEPASGLDPVARVDLRNALRQQAAEGATIILSSHVMAELQDLCTSIGLLHHGRLLDAGPLHDVLSRNGVQATRIRIRAQHAGALHQWLMGTAGISQIAPAANGTEIELHLDEAVLTQADLFRMLASSGTNVTSMHEIETTIEDVMVSLSRTTIPS